MKRWLLFLMLGGGFFSNGQAITTVFTGETSSSAGLAFHGNDLFIAAPYPGAIYKLDVSQANPMPELFWQGGMEGVRALCVSGDYLYASVNPNNPGIDRIVRLDLTGPIPDVQDFAYIAEPNGMTVSGQKLYVNATLKVYTLDLSQSDPQPQLLSNDLGTIFGTVGLAVHNGFLFVSDNNVLVKYDLSVPNPTKTVVNNLRLIGLSLSADGNWLYGTSYIPVNAVYKINPNDGSYTTLTPTNIVTSWGLAVLSDAIFVSSYEGGDVYKIALDGLSTSHFTSKTPSVYPVPAKDYLEFADAEFLSLSDASGKTIQLKSDSGRLDLSGLSAGIYFLRLNCDGQMLTRKIIKE